NKIREITSYFAFGFSHLRPRRLIQWNSVGRYSWTDLNLEASRDKLWEWTALTQGQPVARRRELGAVKRKISVFLKQTLVVGEEFHRIIWLEPIGFDCGVDFRFEKPHQLDLVPLRHGKHFADRASFDYLFDVPTRFFIRIEENVHLSDPSKQIVEVAHNVLISA